MAIWGTKVHDPDTLAHYADSSRSTLEADTLGHGYSFVLSIMGGVSIFIGGVLTCKGGLQD